MTYRFLLLEDSVLDAELTEAVLRDGEIPCDLVRVETQSDFRAALEQEFDLILADYALPSFDGITALDLARSSCPEVPFIFVSATLGEELAIEALKSGATDYVLKQRLGRLPSSVLRALRDADDRRARQRMEAERDLLLHREQAARKAAEAANRIKDEFLAVLSHELRTPLNPILGWIRLLRSREFDPASRDRALETIERNAKLQTQLVEDLLDISRILQGKLSLNPGPIDLAAAITGAIETVSLSATAKSIQLHTDLQPHLGKVQGDLNRLQQIAWNLLSNAIKFTPEGGQVKITLERVETQEQSGLHTPYAQLTVSDNGHGISASFLPHVFDTFRQADSSSTRDFGGLGLGLAIVRHLVELHGGTVTATSLGVGQGASFTVRLPLMPIHPEAILSLPVSNPAIALSGVRVLVVDDDADSLDFLSFVLEQCGAQSIGVASAAAALSALTHQSFDVLISDIAMPIEDGYSLIRQVRSLPPDQNCEIPAIALTAYARDEDRRQSLGAGFQKYLPKPIDPDKLIAIVASLL
jgi:signal transduction histidine kinase